MPAWVITVGTSPDLSLAEFEYVTSLSPEKLNDFQYSVALQSNPQDIVDQLGGTVKIAQILTKTPAEQIPNLIAKHAQTNSYRRIALSSQTLSQDKLKKFAHLTKTHHRSLSYRLLKNVHESAGILDKYQEYQLIRYQDLWILAHVQAVQNIDRWSHKDYDRPEADPQSGMLPPKMARIMVNLSLKNITPNQVLYDPFCGVGTILMEGLDRGVSVVGSDLSEQAVRQAQINCQWFDREYEVNGHYKVFRQDATQISQKTLPQPASAIAFEGYLGPPKLHPRDIPNIHKGMYKLYKGVFKRLPSVLRSQGRIICALPYFVEAKGVKTFDSLVDECEKYGYTSLRSPLMYGREGAKIKRRIYLLQIS